MVFPVVRNGCDSWTIKKAKHQRIDAFELWCWRRLLRVPWTAGKSSQSILNNPKGNQDFLIIHWNLNIHWKDWCWSWSSKTEHQIRRTNSLEKTLMLGKIEGRRRGWQRMRWLDSLSLLKLNGHESEQTPGVGDGQGSLVCCRPWGHKESDMTEPLNSLKEMEVGALRLQGKVKPRKKLCCILLDSQRGSSKVLSLWACFQF